MRKLETAKRVRKEAWMRDVNQSYMESTGSLRNLGRVNRNFGAHVKDSFLV